MNKNQKLIFNMVMSCCIKGSGVFISMVLMRVYLLFFDDKQFLGVWFTILSVLNWILTFDFGIGNGLRNNLVKAINEGNKDEQRSLISSTYALSSCFATIILVLSCLIFSIFDVTRVFNIPDSYLYQSTIKIAIYVTLFSVILQFVLKNINSILYALQLPSLSNFTGLFTNILIFVILQLSDMSAEDADKLVFLSFTYLVASNFPLISITGGMFLKKLSDVKPSIKFVYKEATMKLLTIGGNFFIIQILVLILFGVRELLIAQLWEPGYVVEYQIYYKIFNFVSVMANIALIPMWSAITEAYYKQDFIWLENTYKRLRIMMLFVIVMIFILVITLQILIDIWLGDSAIKIDFSYAVAFGLNSILYILWGTMSCFSNGTGQIDLQIKCAAIGVVMIFLLTFALKLIGVGWIAVIIASIISMLPYCILEPPHIRKILKNK